MWYTKTFLIPKPLKKYTWLFLISNSLVIFSLALTGCYNTPLKQDISAIPVSTERSKAVNPETLLTLDCIPSIQEHGKVIVTMKIKNVSHTTLHIFDNTRMPYLLQQDDDSLLILYGVNPPDPLKNYFMIEIPITKPIQAGETIEEEVSLTPLYFGDHYGLNRHSNTPKQRYGPTTIQCQVGWGHTPILSHKKEKDVTNINALLEWQQLTSTDLFEIDFPFSY